MVTTHHAAVLSPDQLSSYSEHGYLQLDSFVTPQWLELLRSASDEFVEQSRTADPSSRRFDFETGHSAEQPRLRRLVSPVDLHETFHRFAFEGPVAQLAMAILGGPVRFHHSKLNYKWAGGGAAVKWHQDIQFWPHTDFTPLTIGVYLDDVDDKMGPMGVLPGSHRGPLYDLYDDRGDWAGAMNRTDIASLDLSQVVWLKGPAGSVTVHNCCMVHGSLPNHARLRCSRSRAGPCAAPRTGARKVRPRSSDRSRAGSGEGLGWMEKPNATGTGALANGWPRRACNVSVMRGGS